MNCTKCTVHSTTMYSQYYAHAVTKILYNTFKYSMLYTVVFYGLTIHGLTIRKFGWAYYRIVFCGLTIGSNFFSNFLCLLLALKIFQKIGNLWVYSKVYDTLKVGLLQRWIVPILHVIFLILLHSCNLLLKLSPGTRRKLKTYGYIHKLCHFET